MNAPHLHLILNHAPLFGEIAAAIAFAAGALLRKKDFVTAALVAAVVSGALAAATFFSGRAAADAVGRVDGINQEAIGPHEEAAEAFTVTAVIGAAAAAAALRWPRAKLLAAVFVVTALAFGAYAAEMGGRIHHAEIVLEFRAPWNRVSKLDFCACPKRRLSPPRARWVTASGSTPTRSPWRRCARS